MRIVTTHIQRLLSQAKDAAKDVDGMEFALPEVKGEPLNRFNQRHNDDLRELLLRAVRQAEHAAKELEAELHKLEYGYDIS